MSTTSKPYFLYSPDNGMDFFATEKEAMEAAKQEIANYQDNGEWSLDVTSVIMGRVSHRATETDVKLPQGEIDEDGCDETGEYFGSDTEGFCDYKMLPVDAGEQSGNRA